MTTSGKTLSIFGPIRNLTSRQVDLMLGGAILLAVVTGLISWAIGTRWSQVTTIVHALAGFSVLVLTPAKLTGSVRVGLKRRRFTRWLSMALGVMVLATVAFGVLHATGIWYGVGYWSALWSHFLVAFMLLPLVIWHVSSRRGRPRFVDLDRRALLGSGAVLAVAATAYTAQEIVTRATSLAGGDRRFTGSHEIGSFDPAQMPRVQWINDTAPRTPSDDWELTIAGQLVSLDDLAAGSRPVEADLDCTGGWWSRQSWDAVPLATLLPDLNTRSIKVTSATGYSRLLPATDAAKLYLAISYGGQPLRRGHGAPVRLVAPGRRGPWWVKWVISVEPDDRPWWLQPLFPLT